MNSQLRSFDQSVPSLRLPSVQETRERLLAACMQRKAAATTIAAWSGDNVDYYSIDASGQLLSQGQIDPIRLSASCMIKILTAILTVRVCRQQGLTLEDDVSSLLASHGNQFQRFRGVQIRHLLDHTHGLDEVQLVPYPRLENGMLDIERLYSRFTIADPLFAPGELVSYSDIGALLAGALVEKLNGQSFGESLSDLLSTLKIPRPSEFDSYICPSTGGSLELAVVDLLRIAQLLSSTSSDGENLSAEFQSMSANPAPFPGWTTAGTHSCLGMHRYEGDWYGYNATTRSGGSLLLRFHPTSRTAVAVTSRSVEAHRFLAAAFGHLLPECSQLKPRRALNAAEAANVDVSQFAGSYACGVLAAELEANAGQLQITIRNRSESAALLRAQIERKLQLAQDNMFYSVPAELRFLPYGQFIRSPHSNAPYLWSGRYIWRKNESQRSLN